MPCYRPNPAYSAIDPHTGKWFQPAIVYPSAVASDGARSFPAPYTAVPKRVARYSGLKYMTLPCGVCFGCRIDNARSWSLRMMHEMRYHDHNYFITLTYAPEHLPPDADLCYDHLQKFFKKARHEFQSVSRPFKYFACGEYGDKNLRPHYHFAGFDFRLDDLRFHAKHNGNDYYLSDALRDCWKFGHVVVGRLEWNSASYMARYVTKKMRGGTVRFKDDFNPDTGEFEPYTVERAFQSKGLGLPFYEEHFNEIWDLDGCLFNGKYLIKPPRYYFKKLEESDPDRAKAVKKLRLLKRDEYYIDEAKDRELLYSMEATRLSMQTLVRNL